MFRRTGSEQTHEAEFAAGALVVVELCVGPPHLVHLRCAVMAAQTCAWRRCDAVLQKSFGAQCARHGSPGRRADVPGYPVGGKTGTAEKSNENGYDSNRLLSSFVGAFPINDPRYVVFAAIDEPKGTKETKGYATGGWTAAPVVGRVVSRIGPMAGLAPVTLTPPRDVAGNEPLLVTPDGVEIRLASF